jgi:uncharacterized membrane protein
VTDIGRNDRAPDGTGPFASADGGREETGPVRRLLLWLIVLGILGLAAELVLLEHTEDRLQWIPLIALGLGLVLSVAVALRPARPALRAFQAVMASFVAAGVLGVYLHYRGNVEFELESDPALGGAKLLWAALHGATPALAPGALAQLGLLGLVLTYKHPALQARRG